MGTGPHALVCVYLGQREISRGIPQVLSMAVCVGFCFILF